MPVIWWVRRDPRLMDNAALHAALEADSVRPVFILDPAFSGSSPRRKDFLCEGLHALGQELRARNSYLLIRKGKPVDVLRRLPGETNAEVIHAEEDFKSCSHLRSGRRLVDPLAHPQCTGRHASG